MATVPGNNVPSVAKGLKTDNSKTYGCILMKFSGNVLNGMRNKCLDFGSDLDHCLDHPDPGCQMCLCTI